MKKTYKLLNEQIKHELDSAYLYLSMASYFHKENLSGFAHWMEQQANEEVEHAMKIFHFLHDLGQDVTLLALDKPKKNWKSAEQVFKEAWEHEKLVTSLINKILESAKKEKLYAVEQFLQWFVEEQVEEEVNTSSIYYKIKLAGKQGLFMLDHELGKRKD